jgi:hypothetical protein
MMCAVALVLRGLSVPWGSRADRLIKVMVPVFDMLNHDPTAKTHHTYDQKDKVFRFTVGQVSAPVCVRGCVALLSLSLRHTRDAEDPQGRASVPQLRRGVEPEGVNRLA